MNKSKLLYILYIIPLFLISCSISKSKLPTLSINKNSSEVETSYKETIEITDSCNNNTLKDYLEKGWKVINTKTENIPCTWKTVRASKRCNLKSDKGCAIKVPDKMGEKNVYTLQSTK